MKTTYRFLFSPVLLLFYGGLVTGVVRTATGQTWTQTGTNQPGAGQTFAITVPAGVTNFAVSVANPAGSFSELLISAGSPPDANGPDFFARPLASQTAINLEPPEFWPTNYFVMVRTPTNSLAHAFTLSLATNVADLRSSTRPATKALVSTNTGDLPASTWHYYRIEITTNHSGWRVLLKSTNNGPDLYLRRDALPTSTTYLKRSTAAAEDDLVLTGAELIPGAYYIGVAQGSGSSSYTLQTELISFTALTWDPGLTHEGTAAYVHGNTNGGDYYFKITTQNTALGAWRTALNVVSGEASLYLAKGAPPTATVNLYKSVRTGSDGFVLAASAFNAGEDWYYLVRAEPGCVWNLVSGEPYVTDLGTVAADASGGSGPVVMGAEGMRFFRTAMAANAGAWRLWLNGLTNHIFVKQTGVPLSGASDLSQARQMLVVPDYLVGGQLYFVGVNGSPGSSIELDSRLQTIQDLPFNASTNVATSGFGYATFRVQVPAQQLAWQVSMVVGSGNPNVAVRRDFVPNENNNEAYSEVAGTVTDSITLVPNTLSDGTFYITVYGSNAYAGTLQSGNPEFTEINFTGVTINTDTNRVGWRFFKLSNLDQQLGALGWDLFLTNFAPGTRIALRQNAAPGIWNFRNPDAGAAGSYDFLSPADFLQRPGHQADVWYVGVFNTNTALGNFALVTRELPAEPVAFDGGVGTRVSLPANKWQFFRVDVPAHGLGWDLRLANVTSGTPRLVVRRGLLPVSLATVGFSPPINLTTWPNEYQWAAGDDWTARDFSPDGAVNETGRILTMGLGRPVEAATYYVGVLGAAGTTNEMSYTLVSRGIGTGQSIPVTDLNYLAGAVTNTGLPAREIAVYRVAIASNTPSWKVRLAVNSGDAVLAVAKDRIPNISAVNNGAVTTPTTAGKLMKSSGNEHFVQLPPSGDSILAPGTYYLLVASEGAVGTNSTRIGAGAASFTLESIGALPEINLGLLETNDLVFDGTLEGGEVAAFHFVNDLPPTTLGFEITLEDRLGNPCFVSRGELDLAKPGAASSGSGGLTLDPYGNDGGQSDGLGASASRINVSDPYPNETIMLMARASGGDYPEAAYRLRVRKMIPAELAFDGGMAVRSGQTATYEYFKVVVPPGALGWDVRLTNVTGNPKLLIGRDFFPLGTTSSSGWKPGTDTNWPPGVQWVADEDWTERSYAADGLVDEDGRILAMGMGRPLEPGTYYVGIYLPDSLQPASYTLISRGIGASNSIPVMDLAFGGGTDTNLNLPPREAAYYRVVVPPGSPSWRLRLTPLSGEAMLVVLTNHLPSVISGRPGSAGQLMQKGGAEEFVMLPVSPELTVPAGTNFLAVVSEGEVVTNLTTRIGTNASSFVIESLGALPVQNLGPVGATNLVATNTLAGGAVHAYQFTVPAGITSLEAQLQDVTGNPVMVLRTGSVLPNPGAASVGSGPGSVTKDDYGNSGGYPIATGLGNANTNLISVVNPTNGVYTVMVKARAGGGAYPAARYQLVIRATDYAPVAFDGGSAVVTNQPANTWRYYRVEVPTNALGWDVRLVDVTAGLPKLVVSRGALPSALTTGPWSSPGIKTAWPATNRWAAAGDWTGRTYSPDGAISEQGRVLALGMGQPLEPGTYFIGVINSSGAADMTYTLQSRGIGDSFSLPVTELPFAGGSVAVADLTPRETAYFRVQIPSNTPAWKLRLTPSVGEAMLIVLSNRVPNVDSGRLTGALNGKLMQKSGAEHYLLLPPPGETQLAGGTYYLAAVSEGVNPASATRIGTSASSFTLTSLGSDVVTDLGTLGPGDIVRTNGLEGGASQYYQVVIPPGRAAVEIRLENRVGNPVLVAATNATLPDPGGGVNPKDPYGNEGGSAPAAFDPNIVTLPNPAAGLYTFAVKARAVSSAYPDATYTLRVRELAVPALNFTPEFNTNGNLNVASGSLLDAQRAYFKVVVPPDVHGEPVLGWQLWLDQSAGQAGLRVRRDALPAEVGTAIPYTANAAVVAAPLLTPGTWYVEVRGTNSTSFILTSSAVQLQRPAWAMPAPGEPVTTPGLVAPDFGDTGVATNGLALPGDQGLFLERGRYHFYAVQVPAGNGGLLRVQLEGISGNPDFYLRPGGVPTATHATNGSTGVMYQRSLTGSGTHYGNFVPWDGRTESALSPGLYYLAVRAVDDVNARYRLRLSTGWVEDLPLNGGAVTNQSVAGDDWRYFRVQVPADAPASWQISFSEISGDVALHLRDTSPPGNGASAIVSQVKDWETDVKNNGPYDSYDAPGAYVFGIPPVRPNSTYFLGVRAKNDANFSLASIAFGATHPIPPEISFYGGTVTNIIPAYSELAFRIITPTNALRWRSTATHSNEVQIFVENGTRPTKTAADDYRSTTANSVYDRYLTAYPWQPGQTYFMIVTNPTAIAQPFGFSLNGSSTAADDDADAMNDAWEIQYFGSLNASPTVDTDKDGVINLDEYLEGTNPTDKSSYRPRLTLLATNGVVAVNPAAASYALDSEVSLSATANPGYQFVGWTGALTGNTNPASLRMNTNHVVVPRFRVPGDDFEQRINLHGIVVTSPALPNAGATKELAEPNHAGTPGGKSLWWTWTAPASGPVTLTTADSDFRTALAVYTGGGLTNLVAVATNLAAFGTNTAVVNFAAAGGTAYHIAVDGYNGAAGTAVLHLSLATQTVQLGQPHWAEDGLFHFTISSMAGLQLQVEASTNLVSWAPIATVTNVTGLLDFADPVAPTHRTRYYRTVIP